MRAPLLIALIVALGQAMASIPTARGQVLRLEDLQTLAAALGQNSAPAPDEIAGSLPVHARFLARGTLAIRGHLVAIRPASSEPPGRSESFDDVVYSFRAREVFYWREESFLPRSAMPADSLLSFRVGKSFVKPNIEARSHGRTRPIFVGQEYWVMTSSLKLRETGEFSLSGVLPIQDDAIILDYAELELAEEGRLASWPAELRFPLHRYRECLASVAPVASMLAALWDCRSDLDRTAPCEFDDRNGRPGDHFRVGPLSTREDSLRALRLLRSGPQAPEYGQSCRIFFTVESIMEPELAALPFYQAADAMYRILYDHELSLLRVKVEEVLKGDFAKGSLDLYTLIPTPGRGADIAGEKPRQRICPGSLVAGSLHVWPDKFDGQPFFGGPYFVFGVPGTEAYRGDLIEPVLALYRSAP
jgi:hypothetical protein